MPAHEPALPGRQREARSNDSAVLASAREVFSLQGHGASMADVARHAGVGVGSIYRRYPTKDALVEALHVHAVREAAQLAHEIADEADASPPETGAVATFLAREITEATGPILRPPGSAGTLPPPLAAASDDLYVALERLISYDRGAQLVPEGFTPADVMQLLTHLRPRLPFPREQSDALHLRYLALALGGLRDQARTGAELADGPSWDEWVGAWHA